MSGLPLLLLVRLFFPKRFFARFGYRISKSHERDLTRSNTV